MTRRFDYQERGQRQRSLLALASQLYFAISLCNFSALSDIPNLSTNQAVITNASSASSVDSISGNLNSAVRSDEVLSETLAPNQKLPGSGEFVALPEQHNFLLKLAEAFQKRREKNFSTAEKILISLLKEDSPSEVQQKVLLELAILAEEANDLGKAQQILGEYLKRYPDDPGTSDVLLQQGRVCRKLGANVLALSKFYAVLSTALRLKPDRLEYYQRVVVQAQIEIAETYYLQGKYGEAVDFLGRLLKLDSPELQKTQVLYKLIQSLSALGRHAEVISKGQFFIQQNPDASQVAEIRFLLADALKKLGRDREAVQQVMALLEGQERAAQNDPGSWTYWRQRAGNEIANQLYGSGDYISALAIYKGLLGLDASLEWRLPVWYQMGLVYERLQQPQKAIESYDNILAAEKEFSSKHTVLSLSVVRDMAKWRKSYLEWLMQAEKSNEKLTFLHSGPAAIASNESSPPNHK